MSDAIATAAEWLASADAMLIGAGAGMGVDSGLPDFRGRDGFWQAYPPLAAKGLDFASMANPRLFSEDPALAWWFYGQRHNLYSQTTPHAGFSILERWASERFSFVYTTNVDGHFGKAGFSQEQVFEVHGSIHHWHCLVGCTNQIRPARPVPYDAEKLQATEIPRCPECGVVERPNIVMFGDLGCLPDRINAQARAYGSWLEAMQGKRIVIIECGAGTTIPTVRWECEQLCQTHAAKLIRINPTDPHVPPGHLGIAAGAAATLAAIDRIL